MLVIPELEKEVKLLWESRDTRKMLIIYYCCMQAQIYLKYLGREKFFMFENHEF